MAMRGWSYTDCRKFNTMSGALTHVARKSINSKQRPRARSESPQKKNGKGVDRGAGGTSHCHVDQDLF